MTRAKPPPTTTFFFLLFFFTTYSHKSCFWDTLPTEIDSGKEIFLQAAEKRGGRKLLLISLHCVCEMCEKQDLWKHH